MMSPFEKMPNEQKSLLRQSIVATAHKAHPSKEEMMSGLMQEHVARMELARARQHALEAEQATDHLSTHNRARPVVRHIYLPFQLTIAASCGRG